MLVNNVARRGDAPRVRRGTSAGDMPPRQAVVGNRGQRDAKGDSGRALHYLYPLPPGARELATGHRLFGGTADSRRHTDSVGIQGGTRGAPPPRVAAKEPELPGASLYFLRSLSTAESSSACNRRYSSLIRLPAAGSSDSAFSASSASRLPAFVSYSRNLSRVCLMSSMGETPECSDAHSSRHQ